MDLYTDFLTSSPNVVSPIAFELVRKDSFKSKTTNKKGKIETKVVPCVSISKNELARNRLHTLVYDNHVLFKYVAFDTWFSSADNITYIVNDLKKHVVCAIKDNRTVTLDTEKQPKAQKWVQVSDMDIEPNQAYKVRLKKVPFDVLLVKRFITTLTARLVYNI